MTLSGPPLAGEERWTGESVAATFNYDGGKG